jgi:hypothetical protein
MMGQQSYGQGLTLGNLSPWKRGKNNGTRGLSDLWDFSLAASFKREFDITRGPDPDGGGGANQIGITDVQSVYIDNSLNASPTTLTLYDVFAQTIVAPPYSQGLYPVFFSGSQLRYLAASAGSVQVRATFLNREMPYDVWNANTPASGTILISGTVSVTPSVGSFTDRTLAATGGVSQSLAAANPARKALLIRNPATAASENIAAPEPIYVNWTGAASVAGTSWELLPGESLPEFLSVSTEAVNVFATTAGHIIIAKEM